MELELKPATGVMEQDILSVSAGGVTEAVSMQKDMHAPRVMEQESVTNVMVQVVTHAHGVREAVSMQEKHAGIVMVMAGKNVHHAGCAGFAWAKAQ